MKRWLKFGGGGLVGAAIGAVVGTLWAPRRGDELKNQLLHRLQRARLAGIEAKAATEEALIRRYRASVEDPSALRDEEMRVRMETARAVAALGLSLNAPGAIAAQESALRAQEQGERNTSPRLA
jgi:gas vesicle protein